MSFTEPQGAFAWYDLVTPDAAASSAFYRRVVGWGTQSWGEGPDPYTMLVAGETPIGGLERSAEALARTGGRSHWLGYLAVADLDGALAQALARGAKQLDEIRHVPSVGRMVLVADPFGATFHIFGPESAAPPRSGPPGAGEIIWHELATSDAPAAMAFYCEVFGWERGAEMPMGDGTYYLFRYRGRDAGGVFSSPEMPTTQWTFYPRVADAKTACAAIAPAGGQVALEVMQVPTGDFVAVGIDPHGAMFGVVQPPA